jgi:hypothetical protein
MAEWAVHRRELPQQVQFHNSFGEPPVVVFAAESFFIEVLFWFPSRTSIHGHGFSGAFRVLNGYSIQTTYSFTESEVLAPGLRLGELTPRNLELLMPGDVCEIDAKEAYIHSVAHLGLPSLTLVARTFGERGVMQYSYYPSGVACAVFHRRQSLSRQLDMLATLFRSDPSAVGAAWDEFFERQDEFGRFMGGFRLASRKDAAAVNEILDRAASRWPRSIRAAREAARHEERIKRIYSQLRALPDGRAQLCAVLAEIFGSLDEALRQMAHFHPGQTPQATLDRWAAAVPCLPGL